MPSGAVQRRMAEALLLLLSLDARLLGLMNRLYNRSKTGQGQRNKMRCACERDREAETERERERERERDERDR